MIELSKGIEIPVISDIVRECGTFIKEPNAANGRKALIQLIPVLIPLYLGDKFSQA